MSRSVRDLFGFVAALAGQAVLFGVFYFSSPVLGSVPLGHVG